MRWDNLIAINLLWLCGGLAEILAKEDTYNIISSVPQYAYVAKVIGRDKVKVTSLCNQNNSPHNLQLNPMTIKLIKQADMFIINGHGYDDWLVAYAGVKTQVINVSSLLKHYEDLHLWFAPEAYTNLGFELLERLPPKVLEVGSIETTKAQLISWQVTQQDVINRIKQQYCGYRVCSNETLYSIVCEAAGLDFIGFQILYQSQHHNEPSIAQFRNYIDAVTSDSCKLFILNIQATNVFYHYLVKLHIQNQIPILVITETVPDTYSDPIAWQIEKLLELEAILHVR